MAKIAEVQFNSEGGVQPFSTPINSGLRTILFVVNEDVARGNYSGVHSVVWNPDSPPSLLDDPGNGEDLQPGDGLSFVLSGLPQGTFTFTDGHVPGNTGQIVVS